MRVRLTTRSVAVSVIAAWMLVLAVGPPWTAIGRAAPNAGDDVPDFSPESLDFFEKKVRPILVARCFECHSGDDQEPKGGLRLDSRAAIISGGDAGPAVIPGNAAKSLLVDAINYGELYQMPPKSRLPAEEVAILTRWVELELPWPADPRAAKSADETQFDLQQRRASHWAWQPIRSTPPPAIAHADWPRSDIDRFILARLEQAGLDPAPAAEKRTLLRRVTFDLLGLPPTPQQVRAFVEDDSEAAFEKVVDRLLESPAFGERWARHWLDLVRYAESRGHEFDYDSPNAYQYRDYVIRALNADLPYDQFVTEHIAGDLLETPRLHPQQGFNESILGTGFWFLGEWIHSPVDIRQDETDRFDNMVDVFSKTFLGLTVACARCHDHKFDAISQRDYYALFGFLQSSEYRQAPFDSLVHNQQIARQLAQLNDEFRAPFLQAWADSRAPSMGHLERYLLATQAALASGPPRVVSPALASPAPTPPDTATAAPATPAQDELARLTPAQFAPDFRTWIRDLAEKQGLHPATLEAWVAHVVNVQHDPLDPLHAWGLLATAGTDEQAGPTRLTEWLAHCKASAAATPTPSDAITVVNYARVPTEDWLTDGLTFGLTPRRIGSVRLGPSAELPLAEVETFGAARRDPDWKGLKLAPGTQLDAGQLARWDRAGRTLRTPSFEIKNGLVCYQVRGAGLAYVVVDSHRMVNGPLHGSILKEFRVTAERPQWVVQDLRRYIGHGAHVEFVAVAEDELDVLQVVDASQPPAELPAQPNGLLLSLLDPTSPRDLAAGLAAILTETTEVLGRDGLGEGEHAADRAALANWIIRHPELFPAADTGRLSELISKYVDRRGKLLESVRWESRTAMAMWDGSGQDERLLVRGNPKLPRETVPRGLPEAIRSSHSEPIRQGSGRLELARRMLDSDNPFTSRVFVNRVWQHLTGRGLVPTVDNFGVLGQPPSHPELLDHLAAQFMQDGWSIKRLIKSVVMSRTYQMASTPQGRALDVDPSNALLHSMRIRRLEGESIRDTILAVSGSLDATLFGPPVPVYLTPFMEGRGRPAVSGPLDGAGRRSIYLAIRRNFLSPMMLAFDSPQPFSTVGRRSVSNVPAQALILMNDPFVVEQSAAWARRLLATETRSPRERIQQLYETAFTRLPSETESAAALAFLDRQGAELGLSPEQAAADERVWADLCHVLINVKEFIFVN